MWTIGIILLIYGTSSESLKCPQYCHCVETSLLVNNSQPGMDLVDIMNLDENSITLDPTVQDQIKAVESDRKKNETRDAERGIKNEGRNQEMFTYQITCIGLRDLKSLWLQDLPDPTTQLIIQNAYIQSVNNFQQILKETFFKLPKLTDFSIKNSIIQLQDSARSEIRQEFKPFASILNPVLRGGGHKPFHETDCKHIQILNLSNNTLTYLPSDLFHSCSNLQTLDLSENFIKNFEDDIFQPLINILRLDLHRNRLNSLNEAVFRNLTKLLTLDVSQNRLSNVAPSTFQYLVSLNTLLLSGNPLSTILVLLGTGKRLRVIDISKTGLRQIPGTLERSVRTLDMNGNLLTAIQCGDLDSYSLLSYLNLNHNRISYIADDAMGRLELLTNLQLSHNKLFQVPNSLPDNLEILNLSFNLIQNITSSDFTNLSLLKELSLNNNQIRHIEDNSFVNLLKLRTLNLSWNPILLVPPLKGLVKLRVLNLSYFTNVPKEWRLAYKSFPTHNPGSIEVLSLESSPTLSQVFLMDTKTLKLYSNLVELHLRFANLTTLRKDIFSLLPQLKILHLEGNPWHCDKEMLTTSEWLRKHTSSVTSSSENEINTMHCATPLRLYKKTLVALDIGDFEETSSTVTPQINETIFNNNNNNNNSFNVRNGQENISKGTKDFELLENTVSSDGPKGKEIDLVSPDNRVFDEDSTEPIINSDNSEAVSDFVNYFFQSNLTAESNFSLEYVNESESAISDTSDYHRSSTLSSSTLMASETWKADSTVSDTSFWNETSTSGINVTDTADAETLKQNTSSHPGAFFVVLFVGVVIAVSFAIALQQVAKLRRDHGYRLQGQEMEIQSISSELW